MGISCMFRNATSVVFTHPCALVVFPIPISATHHVISILSLFFLSLFMLFLEARILEIYTFYLLVCYNPESPPAQSNGESLGITHCICKAETFLRRGRKSKVPPIICPSVSDTTSRK